MKKITVCILLASILLLTLAACGKDSTANAGTDGGNRNVSAAEAEFDIESTDETYSSEPGTEETTEAETESVTETTAKAATTARAATTKKTTTTAKPSSTTKPSTTTKPTTTRAAATEPTTAGAATTEQTTTRAATSDDGTYFNFTATDLNGKTVKLSDFSDAKVIMINIWEPWCGPCVNEMPEIEKLYEKYKDKGLVVIGVTSQSTVSDAREIVKEEGITYPVIVSNSSFNQFDTGYVPTTVFITGSGKILTTSPIVGSKSYSQWESEVKKYL